ncbi:MAG: hypothetical protein PHQ81_10715, partial [Methanofollis sp.]|nr:hypothetical protein [Methanofollis sp.]
MDYQRHCKEINERMEHLVCFYPFFKAYTSPSVRGLDYDALYLGLGVLTFLIEKGRLQGRMVPPEEIQGYVREMIEEMYPGRRFDARTVTRTVLGILETTPGGELYDFQYLDPVRQQQTDRYVHYVRYDVNEGAYEITDAGLEFMIAIKELPEESRVTVTLILFKKQVESGAFRNALETVRDLNLEVHRKKGKKQALLDSMIYGDPDVVKKFTAYTRDVISQLEQEDELFRQVRATLRELSDDTAQITDHAASFGEEDFIVIKKLADELDYGYRLHNTLLKDYTGIPAEYKRITDIRLHSLFDRRYQFQKMLENHVQANLPNDVHVVEMLPLLLPHARKTFSLCKLFEPQSIIGKKTGTAETRVAEENWGDTKFPDEVVHERQSTTFTAYASVLVEGLQAAGGTLDLPAFLDLVLAEYGDEGVDHIDLIPFLIELNRGVRQEEKEAYETVFDLHTPEDRLSPIEKALVSATAEKQAAIDVIRVRSRPDVRVRLTDERDVYVS